MLIRSRSLLLLLFACHLTAQANEQPHRYQVTLAPEQGLITVNACFAPLSKVTSVTTRHRDSGKFVRRHSGARLGSGPYLYTQKNSQCLDYEVDLRVAQQNRQANQSAASWLVNNRAWLWRPVDAHPIQMTFHDASGAPASVSAPWPQNAGVFLAGLTPVGWTGRIAFGNVSTTTIAVGNQALRLGIVDVDKSQHQQALLNWVQEGANALYAIYRQLPVNNAQILVIPAGKSREAVPWAEVQRDGLPAVHLFVDHSRPMHEFHNDWTLTHELSHLLLPKIAYRDRWASEGLASYYQNVARARAGMLSPEQAWQALQQGFAKGRRSHQGSLLNSNRTKHLYWGGAAFYLLADVALRNHSRPTTLDEVLAKLRASHLPDNRTWRAKELMDELDRLSDTRVFTSLLNTAARQPQFPVATDYAVKNAAFKRVKDDIFAGPPAN